MNSWEMWAKVLHIIAVITWMAGLFYLPRLFVYHADTTPGSEQSSTFKIMERRLLKGIMNPSIVAVWITGPLVATGFGEWSSPWLHAKLALVLILSGYHGYLAQLTRGFANDQNQNSSKFYRIINEIPTVLLILIVILVVMKPF